ncbi:hypothetical protein Tco_1263870 [Tanacetum coccineum]
MYDGAKTHVRTSIRNTEFFPLEVGLHQGSTINPFAFILDELSRGVHEDIPRCLIFADDITLVSKLAEGLNNRLDNRRESLEDNDLKNLQPNESIRYLGSMIHKSGRIDVDVSHRIKVAWLKWRATTSVIYDRNDPLKLKGKFYKVAITPFMLYGLQCWPITKALANRVEVADLRINGRDYNSTLNSIKKSHTAAGDGVTNARDETTSRFLEAASEVVDLRNPKKIRHMMKDNVDMIKDKVDNPCPQSTPQVFPSFELYIPPVTYPKEVEETIGIPMEVKPLDETQLDDLGLNTCNHDIPLSSREVPSFDEPEPQPNPLPNCPPLDISLRDKRGPEPPIKPHSPDSFRMKEVDSLTIHTPPSPHVASFYHKDMYCYYHPCIDGPKKHYGFKPGLLRHSGSLGVDFLNFEMIEDDWQLESKEVSFLGEGLNLPVRPKELEMVIFDEEKPISSLDFHVDNS